MVHLLNNAEMKHVDNIKDDTERIALSKNPGTLGSRRNHCSGGGEYTLVFNINDM